MGEWWYDCFDSQGSQYAAIFLCEDESILFAYEEDSIISVFVIKATQPARELTQESWDTFLSEHDGLAGPYMPWVWLDSWNGFPGEDEGLRPVYDVVKWVLDFSPKLPSGKPIQTPTASMGNRLINLEVANESYIVATDTINGHAVPIAYFQRV